MYEPDESEIEEAFTSILSNLSSTKESITRATKFAMEFITYNGGLFHLIIKRIKKVSLYTALVPTACPKTIFDL